MQHGVKRVRQSKEAIEAKKQREQAKIKDYLALTDDVLVRVRSIDSFSRLVLIRLAIYRRKLLI
jgi:hypothetical protein